MGWNISTDETVLLIGFVVVIALVLAAPRLPLSWLIPTRWQSYPAIVLLFADDNHTDERSDVDDDADVGGPSSLVAGIDATMKSGQPPLPHPPPQPKGDESPPPKHESSVVKASVPPKPKGFGVTVGLGVAPTGVCLLLLAYGALLPSDVHFGIRGNQSVHPYEICILFMSLAFVCISLDLTTLFTMISYKAVRAAGSAKTVFATIFVLSTVVAIVASNDIVVLTLTPIVIHVTRLLGVKDAIPFLIAEFFAANVWSALLYVGNPTNIIVADAFGVSFLEFSQWMTLPAIASGCMAFVMLVAMFQHRIPTNIDMTVLEAALRSDPHGKLRDPLGAAFKATVLAVTMVLIAISKWSAMPIWAVTLGAAILTLSFDVLRDVSGAGRLPPHCIPDETGGGDTVFASENATSTPLAAAGFVRRSLSLVALSRVPWGIIPFMFGMFSITNAMYRAAWFGDVAVAMRQALTGGDEVGGGASGEGVALVGSVWAGSFLVGVLSTVLCNLLNNQPMTILLARLLQHPALTTGVHRCTAIGMRYSLILGSNLGANVTFLGALAGIMWIDILRAHGVRQVTMGAFLRSGLLFTPIVLTTGLIVIAVEVIAWC